VYVENSVSPPNGRGRRLGLGKEKKKNKKPTIDIEAGRFW